MDTLEVDLNKLNRLPVPSTTTDRWHYVYFLFDGDDLVYIGLANQTPQERVFRHTANKKFDSYAFIMFSTKEVAVEAERILIGKYNPKYNRLHRTDAPKGAKRKRWRELDSCK